MTELITSLDSILISEAKEQTRKSKAAVYAKEQRMKSRENPEENARVNQSDKNFRFKRGSKNYVMEVAARILRCVTTFDVTKLSNK